MKGRTYKFFMSILFAAFVSGCSSQKTMTDTIEQNDKEQAEAAQMFTDRDYEVGYNEEESVLVLLNGETAACTSDAVQISGSTIKLIEEGTYLFSGSLRNGQVIVDADKTDKLHLVFQDASIHSEAAAALYILEADKVFITLAEDTVNTLSNGGSFTQTDDSGMDGTIFSRQDLTLNGSGSLMVESPAGNGIVCKDDLVITSGIYTIHAASHGLDANDSIRLANLELYISAGKDGIHAENTEDANAGFIYMESGTLDIAAEGDGLSAGAYLQIVDGDIQITSGGGSGNTSYAMEDSSTSSKGIKAAGDLLVSDGNFVIHAADDAVHSNASLSVLGGSWEIASGDDGFHADETLSVAEGIIHITESYEGLEALHLEITGGDITLYATDDGLNAAGGKDQSGFGGRHRKDRFGGGAFSENSSAGSILISGGRLDIHASGDGIDANGSVTISGGYTTVCGPAQGDTATLDYDIEASITGGTFIGTGASSLAQTFSDSGQGLISVKLGNQPAGTHITLTDSERNTLMEYTPNLPFGAVILSSPEIAKGGTYTVTIGSASGEFVAE